MHQIESKYSNQTINRQHFYSKVIQTAHVYMVIEALSLFCPQQVMPPILCSMDTSFG